jgi:hypothetical protein
VSRVAALAAGLAVAFAGCSGSDAQPRPTAQPTALTRPATTAPRPTGVVGTITAFDQVGDGTRIEVKTAELRGMAGYIVVHAEEAEGPGPVVGHAAIPEGVSGDVVVTLDMTVPPGPYWVMLHRDGGAVGTFEWPGPDGPVRPPVGLTYATKRIVVRRP